MDNATDVGTYFGTTSPEYLRAVFYFGFISKLITAPKKSRSRDTLSRRPLAESMARRRLSPSPNLPGSRPALSSSRLGPIRPT
jgi:hypothetical protein